MNLQELSKSYSPLTSTTRILDMVIPEEVDLPDGGTLALPKCVTKKDIHYVVDETGRKTIKASWISGTLSHVLNGYRLEDISVRATELTRAIQCIDKEVLNLLQEGILRDRRGPGAMAFVQANENIPKDSILISRRAFQALCKFNDAWRRARKVMVIRFPNLGPETTRVLNLVVNDHPNHNRPIANTISNLAPNLKAILSEMGGDYNDIAPDIVDAFYLNPTVLKNSLEGDGDGDQIFVVLEEYGHPKFDKISLLRSEGEIQVDSINTLFKKAERINTPPNEEWLTNYFDDIPIGQATFAIRWKLYQLLSKYKNENHPMHAAWKELAPYAIDLIEFVMDIRKGTFTKDQINRKMDEISDTTKEIAKARNEGNWFAKTVVSRNSIEVQDFIKTFPTLQEYVNYITR